jgi:hypothetical protein
LFSLESCEIDYLLVSDVKHDLNEQRNGNGVIVYVRRPDRQVLTATVNTIPNTLGLQAERSNTTSTIKILRGFLMLSAHQG